MEVEEFRVRGKEMIDYICAYLATMESKRVTPNVEPGYLRDLLPEEAPEEPEEWDKIMDDVDAKIMPGVTHWQHPRFHAYFPSGNSFPSILGDMLSDAIGCIGFSWVSSTHIKIPFFFTKSFFEEKKIKRSPFQRAGKGKLLSNTTCNYYDLTQVLDFSKPCIGIYRFIFSLLHLIIHFFVFTSL